MILIYELHVNSNQLLIVHVDKDKVQRSHTPAAADPPLRHGLARSAAVLAGAGLSSWSSLASSPACVTPAPVAVVSCYVVSPTGWAGLVLQD